MKWLKIKGGTKVVRTLTANGVLIYFNPSEKANEYGTAVSDEQAKILLEKYPNVVEVVKETEFHKKAKAKMKQGITEQIVEKFGDVAKEVLKPEEVKKAKKSKKK